jgi:hypothetical protein
LRYGEASYECVGEGGCIREVVVVEVVGEKDAIGRVDAPGVSCIEEFIVSD